MILNLLKQNPLITKNINMPTLLPNLIVLYIYIFTYLHTFIWLFTMKPWTELTFFSDHVQGPETAVMRMRIFRNVTSALILCRPPVTLLSRRVNSAAWTARWPHKHCLTYNTINVWPCWRLLHGYLKAYFTQNWKPYNHLLALKMFQTCVTDFLLLNPKENILKNVGKQTVAGPHLLP